MRIVGQSRCISWYVSCAVVVLGLALPSVTHAANRYWVGDDGASTNVASNWKTTDPVACGSGDASAAPVSGDVIIFDRDCDNGAIVDSALTVTTTTFQNGYSGIVTLHTSFTTTTFTQSGGTFKLNGQIWTNAGAITLNTGSTFTAGTGTLTLTSGSVTINVDSTLTLYNLIINSTGTKTISASDSLIITNTLTLTDGLVSQSTIPTAGTLRAQGTIVQDSTFDGGTARIVVDGTGDQTFTGNATRTAGLLPLFKIDKVSGTLTLSGTIRTASAWGYSGGTLAFTNNTVVFGNGALTIAGSHSLSNVIFDHNATTARTYTIKAGDTLTVLGNLTIDNSNDTLGSGIITINGGFIHAKGNIFLPDSVMNHTGTTWIYINGTGSQMLSGNASNSTGGLMNVNINKASGTLTLSGTIRTVKTWSYSGGTLDAGSSTVVFGATQTIAGSHTLNNVRFDNYKTAMTATITAPTTLTVNGTLTMDQAANMGLITINGGFIRAKGNISSPDSHVNHTGTTWLYIDGTSDQTLTGAASNSTGGLINVNINKASGTLTLAGTIRTPKTWSYSGGTLDAGSSTVVFGGTVTIAGSHTLNNVRFDNYKTAMTATITAATTLTVNGTLAIDQGGDATIITINTGTINAKGDINAPDTLNHTGTATITIGGTGSQSFTGGASAAAGGLPNININKTSGTLTLLGTIRTMKSWNYTSGTLDSGTSTLVFTGSSIHGSHSLNNVTFNGVSASIASGTTLIITGTLTLSDGTINFGIVSAQASVSHAQGFDGGNGTLLLSGSATRTITFAGSGSLPSLSLTAANTSVVVSGSGPLNIEGNFYQSAGTFTAPAVLKVAQSFNVAGGTFNHNNGTVILSGIDRVFSPPAELYNLTINRNERLLGYWKLDDGSTEATIRDSSGNDNHGTWVGPLGSNTAPAWATPTHESSFTNTGALSFDDTDDRVDLGTFQGVKTGMLWFTVRSLTATKNLMQDGTTFLLQMEVDHPLIYYRGSIVNSSPIILVDEWHHMALVYDGTGAVFYFDGINYGRKSIAEVQSVNLGLGYSTVSGQPAKGLLDDVRLYNRALSSNEIRAIAQGQDTKYSLAGDLSLAGTLTLMNATLDSTSTCYDIDYGSLVSNGGTIDDDCAGSSSSSSSSTAASTTAAPVQQSGGHGGGMAGKVSAAQQQILATYERSFIATATPSSSSSSAPRNTGSEGSSSSVAAPPRIASPASRPPSILASISERRGLLLARLPDGDVLYRDVPVDAWFAPYVATLVDEGIAQGYRNTDGKLTGHFGVQNPVTYVELLKMALEAANISVRGVSPPRNQSARETWAASYVAVAEARMTPVITPDLDVHRPATRAEVVAILLSVLNMPVASGQHPSFSDVPVGHRYASAIATTAFYGLVRGNPDGTFRPDDPINRAEAAKLVALTKELMK